MQMPGHPALATGRRNSFFKMPGALGIPIAFSWLSCAAGLLAVVLWYLGLSPYCNRSLFNSQPSNRMIPPSAFDGLVANARYAPGQLCYDDRMYVHREQAYDPSGVCTYVEYMTRMSACQVRPRGPKSCAVPSFNASEKAWRRAHCCPF